VYYAKKKLRLLNLEPDAAATTIVAATDPTAVATADSSAAVAVITDRLSIIVNVAAAADQWILNANGTVRTPSARWKAKSWQVKPPSMLSSAPEASMRRQLFSVLLLIILPCPLRASSQESARQRSSQRRILCASNPLE
jgi:hypothetical protein